MDIPRCITCDSGIYLSDGDRCVVCGDKLQLSINISKLTEILAISTSTVANIVSINASCALIPPPNNKWIRIFHAIIQGAASAAAGRIGI